jgi:YVTN family beta-propeller protein
MRSPNRQAAALLVVALANGCSGSPRSSSADDASHIFRSDPADNASRLGRTHPNGTIITALRIGGRPFGIGVSRSGIVYSTLLDAGSLARTRLAGDSLTTIAVAAVPTDVSFSPAGNRAFVTNQHARTIGIVDTRTHTQTDAIPVDGDPFRVAVGPEGQRIYATTNAGSLIQIDPETRTVVWTLGLGGNLNGLAITADGSRVYVGDVGGKVYEVDATGEVTRIFAVPGEPQGLALSSDGEELYVAGEGGEFIVIDLDSGSEKARTQLGAGGFGIAITPDQAQVWVTVPTKGQIIVLDRFSHRILSTIQLGGIPRRLAFDSAGSTAVIADEAGTIRFVR